MTKLVDLLVEKKELPPEFLLLFDFLNFGDANDYEVGVPDIGQFSAEQRKALKSLIKQGYITTKKLKYAGIGNYKTHYVLTKKVRELPT